MEDGHGGGPHCRAGCRGPVAEAPRLGRRRGGMRTMAAATGAPHRAASIERHKGGADAVRSMWGRRKPPEAVVWRAAADARAWAATIREHTAWASYVRGWSVKAESDDALRRAAEEIGRAVDAQTPTSADALRRAGGEMRRVARRMGRAADAFGLSSDLNKAAVAELKRAAAAYKRAAKLRDAARVAMRIAMSSEYAEMAAQMKVKAENGARRFGSLAGMLAIAAARPENVGRARAGRPEELASLQSRLLAEAEQEHAKSTAATARTMEIEQVTKAARMAEAAASRSSAAAAARAAADPAARDAASAWKRATRAADSATEADARFRRRLRRAAEHARAKEAAAPPSLGEIGGGGGGAPVAGADGKGGPLAAAAAAVVWRAAADARVWTAALHEQAVSAARRDGRPGQGLQMRCAARRRHAGRPSRRRAGSTGARWGGWSMRSRTPRP